MTGRKNESGAGKGKSRHEQQDDWWQVNGHAALIWEGSSQGYAGDRRSCKMVTVSGHFSVFFASCPLFSSINFYPSQSQNQIHLLTSLVCVTTTPIIYYKIKTALSIPAFDTIFANIYLGTDMDKKISLIKFPNWDAKYLEMILKYTMQLKCHG